MDQKINICNSTPECPFNYQTWHGIPQGHLMVTSGDKFWCVRVTVNPRGECHRCKNGDAVGAEGDRGRVPYGITVSAGYQNQHQNCIRNNLEKTVRRTCITRTASYGPRSCAVSGPTCWNSLLPQLKSVSLTLQQFCDRLKTVLFSRSYA